jgi:hypothetical protein
MKSNCSKENNIPDLTVVTVSRNDDHGCNLLHRMQAFVKVFIAQCKRYRLNAELIFVEWNPPADNPKLREALRWPEDPTPCQIRIIEVPSELHQRFRYSERLPLFQMIGKNVGIVRARGRFILSTNIDIIFSDELIEFLIAGELQKGRIYRVDRYDVSENVPIEGSIDEILDFCRKNILRICSREGFNNFKTNKFERIYSPFPFIGKRLHLIPGWRILLELGKIKALRIPFLLFRLYREWLRLHTNASGDFTLMAKEDWFRLRGAPELEMYSLHLDSLLCYMAHFAGIKEVALEYPIYHIEHTSGWTPEVEKNRTLYNRLEKARIPRLTDRQLGDWVSKMYRDGKPMIFNDENWGLADENLKETVI